MLILFDHGTPKGLARAWSGHTVHTAQTKGWDTLSNGELLSAAEEAGFEYRRIALVVLTGSTKWSRVRQHAGRISAAVAATMPGSFTESTVQFD